MSKEYRFMCKGHNSIYDKNYLEDNYEKRRFEVVFNEPENGVNDETGILLIISGFGGTFSSNINKKMRSQFADKYNLVTIQCDYFGYRFMSNEVSSFKITSIKGDKEKFKNKYCDLKNFDMEKFLEDNSFKEPVELGLEAILDESVYELNDMSIMQAIDNITATLNVISILYNNNFVFNTKKIMIFGNSHGAYLAYLCNALCQNLYTHILDNSAWIYPRYIDQTRVLMIEKINKININFIYKINNYLNEIEEGLSIGNIYKNFYNTAYITCYHGTDDELISLKDKCSDLKNIDNLRINKVSIEDINGDLFKNNNHGLGADFIKLFDLFYNECNFSKSNKLSFNNISDVFHEFYLDYTIGIPKVLFK